MPDPVVYQNPLTGTRWTATGDNAALLLSWGWEPVEADAGTLAVTLDETLADAIADEGSETRDAIDVIVDALIAAPTDAVVAGLVADDESDTGAALNAAYGSVKLSRPGSYAVFLGDSITLGNDDPTSNIHADSWPTYAGLISGQRIQTVRNAGIGGNNVAQMLARFDTDVTPYAPSLVTILAGTNDLSITTFANYKAGIQALVGKVRAISAGPVLGTIPPSNTGSKHADIEQWNLWLRLYAAQQGIPLLDFHSVLADPATGDYAAAYNSDGTHPNPAGQAAMGAHAAAVLASQLPATFPPLPVVNDEAANLVNDGLFLGTVTSGIAAGWGPYGSVPSGSTPTVVTDSAVLGKMQRVTSVAAATDTLLYQSLGEPGGDYDIGDVLAVCGVLTASGIGADCRMNFWNGTGVPVAITRDVTRGVFYSLVTVPATATTCDFLLYFRAGTGLAEFGRMGVYNLTALGLA